MVRDTESLTRAVELLEENAGRTMGDFTLLLTRWPDDQSDEERRNESLDFRRFVDALGRGDVAIREIEFVLTDWDGLPDDDMERLFGQVLPSHPTLRSIAIRRSNVLTRFMRLLTSSVLTATNTTSPLTKLELSGRLTHDDVRAIADMVDRHVALSELSVFAVTQDGLSAADGKVLCQAVARNAHLQALRIRVDEVSADSLDLAVSSSSSLRELEIWSIFSERSVSNLATQLRTNTKLTRLVLRHETLRDPSGDLRPNLFRPIENALESLNYSLVDVSVQQWGIVIPDNLPIHVWRAAKVDRLVRRNRRIQRALEELEPKCYHVSPTALWPSVLEVVSPVPTLVYRILRKGDVNKLCDFLRRDENLRGSKKRGRDVDGDSVVREQLEG
jgi:hypothetical protein